jgi:hypothetical protein
MLQPIKIIIIIAACTLLPVINESRSFAESADRKKAYKSRAKEAFKSSARRQSRSSRNDKKRSRTITRKASQPKVSSKNESSKLQSRSLRNDEKRSDRGITRKANRPQVSSQNKAQRKLKSLTAKSRRDRDNGKQPIAKLPNQDRGQRLILKLPIGKPLVEKIPIDKRAIDKRAIDKRRDDKIRNDKRKDDKLRDDKRRGDRRRRGSGNPNIGLERFKDILRDRVGPKPDLRKKVDWKDLRGRLSRIRNRSSYHVGSGLSKQYRQSRSMALKNLTLGSHCHWWLDFVVGHSWDTHHCHWWDYCVTPGYWDCWTPCHFRVIHCPPSAGIVSTSWYFGIDCILIPDLSAYGIQEVDAGSPADMAGLVVGDMIVGINGSPITSEFDLSEAITVSGGHLHLDVVRDGADSSVEIHVDLARLAVRSY